MANLQFSADLVNDILFRAGEKTDGTSDYEAQALIYLNRAYRTVYHGGMEFSPEFNEQWVWASDRGQGLNSFIEASISAGTVTVTRGSTAATLTVAPQQQATNVSVSLYRFKIEGEPDIYEIASHTSGSTSLTLQSPYTGTTGGGKSYRLMRHRYDIPSDTEGDKFRALSPIYFYQDGGRECNLVAHEEILKFWASGDTLSGVPQRFSVSSEEDELNFDRYGSDTANEQMTWAAVVMKEIDVLTDSGTQQPRVPLPWRHVLSDLGLYYLYVDKDDSRAQILSEKVKATLTAMKTENRARIGWAGRELGKIYPRGRKSVERLRTSSGKLIGYFR